MVVKCDAHIVCPCCCPTLCEMSYKILEWNMLPNELKNEINFQRIDQFFLPNPNNTDWQSGISNKYIFLLIFLFWTRSKSWFHQKSTLFRMIYDYSRCYVHKFLLYLHLFNGNISFDCLSPLACAYVRTLLQWCAVCGCE
jgi:hypothetical protein